MTLRSDLLRIASELPKGDPTRREIIAAVKVGGDAAHNVEKRLNRMGFPAHVVGQRGMISIQTSLEGSAVAEKMMKGMGLDPWTDKMLRPGKDGSTHAVFALVK